MTPVTAKLKLFINLLMAHSFIINTVETHMTDLQGWIVSKESLKNKKDPTAVLYLPIGSVLNTVNFQAMPKN